MNTTFEKYLDTIDKCLKPLPTSERVDIVKEIKGSILEMEARALHLRPYIAVGTKAGSTDLENAEKD